MVWPLIYRRWQTFTFLHWAYDRADVQCVLPSGLDVHTYDGVAWVGLTPFSCATFARPGFPPSRGCLPSTVTRRAAFADGWLTMITPEPQLGRLRPPRGQGLDLWSAASRCRVVDPASNRTPTARRT